MTVFVIAGGLSHEREVSLRSGKRLAGALRKRGHAVTETDVNADLIPRLLGDEGPVAIPVLHGGLGEDGALRGTILHSSFERFYCAAGVKFNFDKFSKIYSAIAADAGLARFDAELELQKIKKIAPLLQQHEQTWSFACGEQRCEGEFEGVRLSGRIDRIDEDGRGGKFIIDYKSSSGKPQSFQLSFYQALLGCECESAYLALGDEGFVRPGAKTPTLQALREKLSALKEEFAHEVVFARTDEPKICEYCAYKIICKGRIDGKI